MIEGANPSEMLGFIPPQLAALKLKAQVGDKRILPKLYSMAAKVLNLAPGQHTEEPIKAILGGAMTKTGAFPPKTDRLRAVFVCQIAKPSPAMGYLPN